MGTVAAEVGKNGGEWLGAGTGLSTLNEPIADKDEAGLGPLQHEATDVLAPLGFDVRRCR